MKNFLKIVAVSALPLMASCSKNNSIDIKPANVTTSTNAYQTNTGKEASAKDTYSCDWSIVFRDTTADLSAIGVLFNGKSVRTGTLSASDPHQINGNALLHAGDSLRFQTGFNTDYTVKLKLYTYDQSGNRVYAYEEVKECDSSHETVEFKIR